MRAVENAMLLRAALQKREQEDAVGGVADVSELPLIQDGFRMQYPEQTIGGMALSGELSDEPPIFL